MISDTRNTLRNVNANVSIAVTSADTIGVRSVPMNGTLTPISVEPRNDAMTPIATSGAT
jgi:hypothetical protein